MDAKLLDEAKAIKAKLKDGEYLEFQRFAMTKIWEDGGSGHRISDRGEPIEFYDLMILHRDDDGQILDDWVLEIEDLTLTESDRLVKVIESELGIFCEDVGEGDYTPLRLSGVN